jgi:hypothetical protein
MTHERRNKLVADLSARRLALVVLVSLVSGAVGGFVALRVLVPSAQRLTGKLLDDKQLTPDDWLLGAPNDAERFRRLQKQFIGFAQPMWEVGERFTRIHEALGRSNYERAAYQWTKIQQVISNAIVRRPARAANAHAFFLDSNYQRLLPEFESGDPARAWRAFDEAKGICQGCHVAERAAFANNQALFDLAPPAPYARH